MVEVTEMAKRARTAGPERITEATWARDAILVGFETGERFRLPVAAFARGRAVLHAGLEVGVDGWHVVVPMKDGSPIELPGDYIRYECDARYRAEAGAEARRTVDAVGRKLVAAREQAGLTQAALAKASRVSRVTIARVETGTTSPSFVNLKKLAKALGLTVAGLLDFRVRKPGGEISPAAARRRGRSA